jgi:hypothetical protein
MADTATKNAPANTDAKVEGDSKRNPRTTPTRVGKVDGIPKTSKNGYWTTEIEALRKSPGETYQYADVSQTTASYLRKTYGVEAATRNNTKEGRADLYVKYPAKEVNGSMVADEAEVRRIKAQYEDK